MSQIGDLLQGIAAAMWVLLALVVFLALRPAIARRLPSLTRVGVGATGVSMEFAELKLDEAVSAATEQQAGAPLGEAAKRGVLNRLERNLDIVARARLLWVDDHPENNTPIVELLSRFGARVDTPRTNATALSLLGASRYDVVISDVGRDSEEPGGDLKGIELAETVYQRWGQQTLLFTARFDPTTLPNATDKERLEMARRVEKVVFGRTNRFDEALHLILDVIERDLL